MAIPLSLATVIFIHGVYCPGIFRPGAGIYRPETQESLQDLPSSYPLQSCLSNSPNFELRTSSTYEFECSEETPSTCRLIECSSSSTSSERNFRPFRRADVEFISLLDEEITLAIHDLSRIEWSATCYFFSATMARKFYKLVTQERHYELEPFARADYLKNPHDIVIAEQPKLYSKGEYNITIEVTNDVDDVVLIFKPEAVREIEHYDSTRIEFFINSIYARRQRLYKFGFSDPLEAASLVEVLM